jgi:hypothetical protein
MRGLIVVAALLALSGCKTAEERAAADDTYCQGLGVRPGDPSYVQCRLTLRQEQETKRQAAVAGLAAGLQGAADNIARNQAIANANRPVNCTSTRLGQQVNTTCY